MAELAHSDLTANCNSIHALLRAAIALACRKSSMGEHRGRAGNKYALGSTLHTTLEKLNLPVDHDNRMSFDCRRTLCRDLDSVAARTLADNFRRLDAPGNTQCLCKSRIGLLGKHFYRFAAVVDLATGQFAAFGCLDLGGRNQIQRRNKIS